MKFVLFKTANGWIVTDDDFLTSLKSEDYHVFQTMRALTSHLLKQVGESEKRDSKGRFAPVKEAA